MPRYSTRCNIPVDDPENPGQKRPCGKEIVITPGLQIPQAGESPAVKAKAFVQAIVGHFMKHHEPVAALSMNLMEQFLAYFVIGMTQCEDPGVLSFMAQFAEHLCKISTLPVSDQMIVELVAHMGLTMEDPMRSKIIEAITYVRNFQLRKITPQTAPAPSLPEAVSANSH
jgi:hypothetical protein